MGFFDGVGRMPEKRKSEKKKKKTKAGRAGAGGAEAVEILAIGDELLDGTVREGNASFISGALFEIGVKVSRHTTVGDDPDQIISALKEVSKRAAIAFVTGGLGPTPNDLTTGAASKAAGVQLAPDGWALGRIRQRLQALGKEVTPHDEKLALIPAGAELIRNEIGTASGFKLGIGKCLFYFLPGVPREMRLMLKEGVFADLNEERKKRKLGAEVASRTYRTFGIGESRITHLLENFDKRYHHDVTVGVRYEFPEVLVKVVSHGRSSKEADDKLNAADADIRTLMGPYIYGFDSDTFQGVIGEMLKRSGATLAVAESCSGGLLGHMMTNTPGSSDYFLLGATVYSNQAKTDVLGVPKAVLLSHGAVSRETAKAMAQGVRQIAGSTYGLAVSGIAGPTGGTSEKPVGTVIIALATSEEVEAREHLFTGSRIEIKTSSAWEALATLKRRLIGGR